jgi:hypothetical protein
MDSFLLNVVQPVLEVDGKPQRPMTYYVEEPDDIDDLFDWIAYEKGKFNAVSNKSLEITQICLSWKCFAYDAKCNGR